MKTIEWKCFACGVTFCVNYDNLTADIKLAVCQYLGEHLAVHMKTCNKISQQWNSSQINRAIEEEKRNITNAS